MNMKKKNDFEIKIKLKLNKNTICFSKSSVCEGQSELRFERGIIFIFFIFFYFNIFFLHFILQFVSIQINILHNQSFYTLHSFSTKQ